MGASPPPPKTDQTRSTMAIAGTPAWTNQLFHGLFDLVVVGVYFFVYLLLPPARPDPTVRVARLLLLLFFVSSSRAASSRCNHSSSCSSLACNERADASLGKDGNKDSLLIAFILGCRSVECRETGENALASFIIVITRVKKVMAPKQERMGNF